VLDAREVSLLSAFCASVGPIPLREKIKRKRAAVDIQPRCVNRMPNSVLPIADGVALIALNPTLVAVRLAKNFAS
jgi:hypothetical protein